jgi:hypothetical protein
MVIYKCAPISFSDFHQPRSSHSCSSTFNLRSNQAYFAEQAIHPRQTSSILLRFPQCGCQAARGHTFSVGAETRNAQALTNVLQTDDALTQYTSGLRKDQNIIQIDFVFFDGFKHIIDDVSQVRINQLNVEPKQTIFDIEGLMFFEM